MPSRALTSPRVTRGVALAVNAVVVAVGANLLFLPRRTRGATWVMAALIGWGALSSLALLVARHPSAAVHTQRRLHRIAALLNAFLSIAALLFGLLSVLDWPPGGLVLAAALALLLPPLLNLWALHRTPTW
jgi:cobalamin synthase